MRDLFKFRIYMKKGSRTANIFFGYRLFHHLFLVNLVFSIHVEVEIAKLDHNIKPSRSV